MRILLFSILLGSSTLALAAPTTKPKPAVPASAKPVLEKINPGELRLDGKVSALLGAGVWQLDAVSWTSPRGVTSEFDDVKVKAVQLLPNALVHPLGSAAKVDLKNIKLKTNIAVIGKNGPDGTVLVREVILLEGFGDLQTVGTLSSNRISNGLIDQSRRARQAGQLEKALDLARKAAETASGMNDLSGEALASQDVAILYSELKQPQNALESFKRGQTLGERINSPLAQTLGLEGQADVLADMGQFDQAVPLIERAVAVSASTSTALQISVLGSAVNIYTRAKKRGEAVGALVRLFPLEDGAGKSDQATSTLLRLVRLQAPTDMASAKTYLEQARPRMETIRDDAARQSLMLSFATALQATGDSAGAANQFETAAKAAEAKGDAPAAAQIRALAAKVAAPATAPATDAPAPNTATTPIVPEG